MSDAMQDPRCAIIPNDIPTRPALTGPGALLMFILTALLTILLGTSLFVKDCRQHLGHWSGPSLIRRHLIHHYSNTQIASSIAYQTFALISTYTLVSYHFSMIWLFSLVATAAHSLTLLVLTPQYKQDKMLRWFRIVLMLLNQALNCAIAVITLRTKVLDLPSTLPVACVRYYGPKSGPDLHWFTFLPVTLTVTGNFLVFILAVWYLNLRSKKFFLAMKAIGVALMWLIVLSSIAEIVMESQAFGTPPVPLRDLDEQTWDPAQGLMFMSLGLPLMTAMEIQRSRRFFPHFDYPTTNPAPDEDGECGHPPSTSHSRTKSFSE